MMHVDILIVDFQILCRGQDFRVESYCEMDEITGFFFSRCFFRLIQLLVCIA